MQEKPFIHESLEKGLINLGALAEFIKPEIEKDLGKVKITAISMAIRRYLENHRNSYKKIVLTRKSDLLIKSNLFEISLFRSRDLNKKLIELYKIVHFDIGDTLNIIHGNYEVLIISNEKYIQKIKKVLKGERIKKINENISSLSIKIPEEYINKPGLYFAITKVMALNNISILDFVNTETEATLILEDKNISKSYDLLKKELGVEYYEKEKN